MLSTNHLREANFTCFHSHHASFIIQFDEAAKHRRRNLSPYLLENVILLFLLEESWRMEKKTEKARGISVKGEREKNKTSHVFSIKPFNIIRMPAAFSKSRKEENKKDLFIDDSCHI
ncbi:hypothetical protein OUZ56_013761 [Daphnia magna]|uniref:Uncharacterized protein n=1 Tax=Daphnia magna TaxID=35525 RepID=A0ABQ9Z6V0_9CRUS|nr:hypothetical protein OUZ56_013761 [Daphnia magna]